MIHVRAYPVLGALMVEITCHHGAGREAAHLVYREEVATETGDGLEALGAITEVVVRAHREAYEDRIELYEDCGL